MTADVVIAGAGPTGLLVRPDGYVAWAADEHGAGPVPGLLTAPASWFGPADRG